jgi:predicted permease
MTIELQLEPDLRVLLFAMATALATTVLCGLAPALQSTRPGLVSGLKSEERSILHRRFTLRNGLVVGQVAVSLTLLITSFLFLRSLKHIADVDPGFNVDHVLTAKIRFDLQTSNRAQQDQVLQLIRDRVQSLPGVLSASLASIVPLVGDRSSPMVELEDQPDSHPLKVNANNVGPRYFETMMIPLVAGREFTPSDTTGPPAVIVNETFAKRYLAGKNPLGARVREYNPNGSPAPWSEIVGLARDIKFITLGEDPTPVLYKIGGYQLHARTAGSPALMLPAIKQAIAEIDRSATVEVKTMQENMAFAFVPNRIAAALLGTMGGLGLLLAMIGLYGVMATAVTRRTREIGIRMALGAERPVILRMILGSGLALVGVGVTAGLVISLALTGPLSGFLASGVSPTDPMTFGLAAGFLAVVGVGASYVPARRATRVDPMISLRYE